MSQCISSQGNHNAHDPDNLHVCQRCGVWDKDGLRAEVEHLQRWKREASEVILGLQDLGKALGLMPGTRITGRTAADVAKKLKAERDDLRAKVGALGGAQAITAERQRQIDEEGYTPEHDERHPMVDFVSAAVAYLGGSTIAKPVWVIKRADPDSRRYQRRDLVKAGALIAAAIDRLDQIEGRR